MNKDKLFQFTHPCGCDPHVVATINLIAGFNSRTRVGATGVSIKAAAISFGFNSRTRVGATVSKKTLP